MKKGLACDTASFHHGDVTWSAVAALAEVDFIS